MHEKAQLESAKLCKLVLRKEFAAERDSSERDEYRTQCLFFPEQFEKPVVVKFDEPCSSSDGGALLLQGSGSEAESE